MPESIGDKLVALNAIRDDASSADAIRHLRKSLDDPSNRVVERAVEILTEAEVTTFVDDFVRVYRRLLSDPHKADPGCLAKTAIVRALVKHDFVDVNFYREGIEYYQPEPIWGGEKDTAAELRGLCALGLATCAEGVEVLNRCAVLLADREAEARSGAARAIGVFSQPEGGALLRLKLLTGDPVPEVIGECCSALLSLEPQQAIPFILPLVDSESANISVQVALALGASRLPEAFEPLRQAWQSSTERTVRESLLLCIGLLRSQVAWDFLLTLIDRRDLGTAADALKGLKVCRGVGSSRSQVAAAVEALGDAKLRRTFEKEWPEE